jgi:hypothetical protein
MCGAAKFYEFQLVASGFATSRTRSMKRRAVGPNVRF